MDIVEENEDKAIDNLEDAIIDLKKVMKLINKNYFFFFILN